MLVLCLKSHRKTHQLGKNLPAHPFGNMSAHIHHDKKFDRINRNAANAYYDADYYGVTMGPTVNSINNLGLCFIAVFGSFLYMAEAITPP